jgi:hypothetical protein
LTPIVEQLVAAEVRRTLSGQTDSDDENGFVPFPFMFGGGGPILIGPGGGPPPQGFQRQQQQQQQQQVNEVRVRKK